MELTTMARRISMFTIVVFLLQLIFDLSRFALYSDPSLFRGYQLITHMLLHQNLSHLISNLILFIIVAPVVENYLGDNFKFTKLYLYSGMVGALAQLIAFNGSAALIGASGAIYGVLGACLLMDPKHSIKIFRIKVPMLLIGALLIIPEIVSCFSPEMDGIGHFCHIGGLLTGMIYYFFNRK